MKSKISLSFQAASLNRRSPEAESITGSDSIPIIRRAVFCHSDM